MISVHPIRFARPSSTLLRPAGVYSAVVALAALAILPASSQTPGPARPAAAPRMLLPQRPAPHPAPAVQPRVPPVRQPENRVTLSQPSEVRSMIGPVSALQSGASTSAPAQPRPLPQVSAAPALRPNANRAAQNQLHIGQWMETHRHLPLVDQQRALENEPGFRSLRPQEQQQLHQRLTQLNNMSIADRSKLIGRTEAMESLAPVQRQQVRNAMAQLGSIPEERRHVVSRQFFQLRDMPPAQRQTFIESPQYRTQFNEQERTAIGSLLNVAPIYAPLQATPTQPR